MNHGNEISFVLLNCTTTLGQIIKSKNSSIVIKEIRNTRDVIEFLVRQQPEIVMSDDSPGRMRLLLRLKEEINVQTCVYVQILYGTHSIVDSFDMSHLHFRERFVYRLTRFIPFNLLKMPYKRLLLKQDLVIANSQITATLLHTWYGLEPDTIIYPPVDKTVFERKGVPKEANQILLYLGSHAGDTNENFVRKICESLQARTCKIVAFGNKRLQNRMKRQFRLEALSDVSDETLANVYCRSTLTICPQKWETFGYVIAESIACGTPVLTLNLMGQGEITMLSENVFSANSEKEFLKQINDMQFETNYRDYKHARSYAWDAAYSSKKLDQIIKNLK